MACILKKEKYHIHNRLFALERMPNASQENIV